MADFLNSLAARALGTIALAEPAIPTRFSRGAEATAFLATQANVEATRGYSETSFEGLEDRRAPLRDHQAEPTFENRSVRATSPFRDEDLTAPPSGHSRAFPPQTPPSPRYAESETVPPPFGRDEFGTRHPLAAASPVSEAGARSADVPFAEPHVATIRKPLAQAMRSLMSQPSERFQTLRPSPPAVTVSIGRIEVRAEITSPLSTAAAQRPRQSSLSLDQFLKQVDGSAR